RSPRSTSGTALALPIAGRRCSGRPSRTPRRRDPHTPGGHAMSSTISAISATPWRLQSRPLSLAIVAGLACAMALGRALPVSLDGVSDAGAPLRASGGEGPPPDKVEPIGSYALPNVPGKRVTIVRVTYGPGGFSRPHRHAGSVTAYITKGEIRSQL